MPIQAPTPQKQASAPLPMPSPTPTVNTAFTIPMGFAGQVKALQDAQRKQEGRITALELENAELKSFKEITESLVNRIDALEQQNFHLTGRRRACVGQLLNLRPLHQEASNAFSLRAQDIQPDDLEGMLMAYTTSVTSVMNHHQCVLSQMRASGQMPFSSMATPPTPPVQAPRAMQPPLHHHPYPTVYMPQGYCRAHNMPLRCRLCGH